MRREALRELAADERAARAAPLVDRLVVVADDRHARARAREKRQQAELRVVAILELVDHEMLEAVGEPEPRGIGLERAHAVADEIVEGAEALGLAPLLEARVDAHEELVVRVPRVRGRDEHRLPLADRLEAALGVAAIVLLRPLRAIRELLADRFAHRAQDRAAVGDELHARHGADILEMPHDAERERVPGLHAQRARVDACGRETRLEGELRGLVEHHRAHLRRRHAADRELREAVHHRRGLAAARDREHREMRVVARLDDGPLLVGEMQTGAAHASASSPPALPPRCARR